MARKTSARIATDSYFIIAVLVSLMTALHLTNSFFGHMAISTVPWWVGLIVLSFCIFVCLLIIGFLAGLVLYMVFWKVFQIAHDTLKK
jgi:hypothetical protein